MKEEDKRLQEVLDKARRFTKKLLDDEDYRPPNDEIKRFKNEDAVLSRRPHLTRDREPSSRVAAMASGFYAIARLVRRVRVAPTAYRDTDAPQVSG